MAQLPPPVRVAVAPQPVHDDSFSESLSGMPGDFKISELRYRLSGIEGGWTTERLRIALRNAGCSLYRPYDAWGHRLAWRAVKPGILLPQTADWRHNEMALGGVRADRLIPLADLESQRTWNQQTDTKRVNRQYAESYMAVKYLAEKYGETRLLDVLTRLNAPASLGVALEGAIGVSYAQFQADFTLWLKAWKDPTQTALLAYFSTADSITDEWDAVLALRTQTLQSNNLPAKTLLVSRMQALQTRAAQVAAPAYAQPTQTELVAALKRVTDWLQLEADYVATGADAKRQQANAMIPEVNARRAIVATAASDLKQEYGLG